MVILLLLLSSFLLQLTPGIKLPDPAELVLFPFLLSSLFLSFLSPNSFKGGSSSLLLFLAGCHFKVHVALCQFGGRDSSPPGQPRGRVSNCRTLVVQMCSDSWGKTSLGMSVLLSSPLFWPSHGWRGDGLSPASTISFELSSQFLTFISTFISEHVD